MSAEWRELARAKLATMERYLGELEVYLPLDEGSYLADRGRQLAVERLCQLVVECAIDCTSMLLGSLGEPPPQSAREGFEKIEGRGILSSDLARQFRVTFVGFRHRLVHDYERLDNRIIYRAAKMLAEAGRQYIASVALFLEGLEGGEG